MKDFQDYTILTIVRKGEIIWESVKTWHVPRVGEYVGLAKWDNVYKVTRVLSVFGKDQDVQTVKIDVEADY